MVIFEEVVLGQLTGKILPNLNFSLLGIILYCIIIGSIPMLHLMVRFQKQKCVVEAKAS
jgi:hypothetical protein